MGLAILYVFGGLLTLWSVMDLIFGSFLRGIWGERKLARCSLVDELRRRAQQAQTAASKLPLGFKKVTLEDVGGLIDTVGNRFTLGPQHEGSLIIRGWSERAGALIGRLPKLEVEVTLSAIGPVRRVRAGH